MLNRYNSYSNHSNQKQSSDNRNNLYSPTIKGKKYPTYYQRKGRVLQTTPANNYEAPDTMINNQILAKYYRTLVDYNYPVVRPLRSPNYVTFSTEVMYFRDLFANCITFTADDFYLLLQQQGKLLPDYVNKTWHYLVQLINISVPAGTYDICSFVFNNDLFDISTASDGRLFYVQNIHTPLPNDDLNNFLYLTVNRPHMLQRNQYYLLQGYEDISSSQVYKETVADLTMIFDKLYFIKTSPLVSDRDGSLVINNPSNFGDATLQLYVTALLLDPSY